VIGAPIDSAAEMDAEVLAPAALRGAGLVERVGLETPGTSPPGSATGVAMPRPA
jgi:hypothetical protein